MNKISYWTLYGILLLIWSFGIPFIMITYLNQNTAIIAIIFSWIIGYCIFVPLYYEILFALCEGGENGN